MNLVTGLEELETLVILEQNPVTGEYRHIYGLGVTKCSFKCDHRYFTVKVDQMVNENEFLEYEGLVILVPRKENPDPSIVITVGGKNNPATLWRKVMHGYYFYMVVV